ncbi:RING finger protein 214 [Triplophysa rosa]|uniref:RING finger protein 214 n=1 Tax=Triplophysa rosa TaxID=992332 RepID=A0A9W7X2W2_TRIRA|nr:RING finger protein 214 [Triplophysa rosa]XP_057213667.1 RING finger protein 214 [Triplophysa rosa]XP_057213676.1 RING finger protein 214 [Triplophysa rosa]KAI7812780.1 putative RING finger protein 214 [Triplophysa rosa]
MESEWSFALDDEDLVHCPDSVVIPPDPSPWISSSTGIWSTENSLPAVLNEYAEDPHNTFPLGKETHSQTAQTENSTEERSTNTNEDWKSDMRSIDDCRMKLTQEYEALLKQHAAEKDEHNLCVSNLQKTIQETGHRYKGFIQKIESLQTKLELNSSKTTRKNFMIKRQELTAEKEGKEKEKTRLAQELEDTDKKIKMLKEEQSQEKLTWEKEIADLRVEMETLCRQAEQANQTALSDEMAALEMQKELAVSEVEDWIADTERYLNYLRLNPSQQNLHQRQKWEQNLVMVRNNPTVLKNKFNDHRQLLQRGEQLENLPQIPLPSLPPVPIFELIITSLQNPVSHPVFSTGPPTSTPSFIHPQIHPSATPPQVATPPLSAPSQNTLYPPAVSAMGPPSQIFIPTSSLPQPLHLSHVTPVPPQMHPGIPGVSLAPPVASAATYVGLPNNPRAAFYPQATVRPPQTLVQTTTRNSSPQPLPSNPSPAGKLDKVLEKLGSHFPQSTRDQLTRVLQQIKSERGTMAGLSMDHIISQVAQKLAQNQRPPPGPIAPPSGARPFPGSVGPIQHPPAQLLHPMRPHFRAPVAQVFHTRPPQPSARKFCLICQNSVDAGNQYSTNCSHTMHKDCVSVWLKTSKNNSCPFCPSK